MHGFYQSKSTLHILCIANSFFLTSQDLLRTFISAWFLPHFERLGAPEVSKESVPKSTFPTVEETISERGPLEGPARKSRGTRKAPQGTSEASLRRRVAKLVNCCMFVSFAVPLRRSPCVLACSRLSLHVRVLRCSAVEASDARCASLHVPVFVIHSLRFSLCTLSLRLSLCASLCDYLSATISL